jgi:class 3 adenylate cyclase
LSDHHRKLAAILAADTVGYGRLMGRDEGGTLDRWLEHKERRFDPIVAHYRGTTFKMTGDGMLAEFDSAVHALSAAIMFQQAMADANRNQPHGERIIYRIGLHLGDLIHKDGDVYGDGVNVACRLESQAPEGGILISQAIRDSVGASVNAAFQDRGYLNLKHVVRGVQAFTVSWEPAIWPQLAPPFPAPVAPKFSWKPIVAGVAVIGLGFGGLKILLPGADGSSTPSAKAAEPTSPKASPTTTESQQSRSVSSQPSGSQAWSEYRSEEGRYRVEMPAKPILSTTTNGGTTLHQAIAVGDTGASFVVTYNDFTVLALPPETLLEIGRNGAVQKHKLLSDQPMRVAGNPAREYVFERTDTKTVVFIRSIIVGTRLYQVVVATNSSDAANRGPDVRHFIDSFSSL